MTSQLKPLDECLRQLRGLNEHLSTIQGEIQDLLAQVEAHAQEKNFCVPRRRSSFDERETSIPPSRRRSRNYDRLSFHSGAAQGECPFPVIVDQAVERALTQHKIAPEEFTCDRIHEGSKDSLPGTSSGFSLSGYYRTMRRSRQRKESTSSGLSSSNPKLPKHPSSISAKSSSCSSEPRFQLDDTRIGPKPSSLRNAEGDSRKDHPTGSILKESLVDPIKDDIEAQRIARDTDVKPNAQDILSSTAKYITHDLSLLTNSGRLWRWYIRYFAAPKYNEFKAPYSSADFNAMIIQVPTMNPAFFIHPRSQFRAVWGVLMSIIYLAAMIAVPIFVSFPKSQHIAGASSLVYTILCSLDIVVHIFSLHTEDGQLLSARESLLRYARTQFPLDILTALPWYLVLQNDPSASYYGLIRLLRLYHLGYILLTNPLYTGLSRWIQTALGVGESFVALILFLGLLGIVVHLYACALFLMGAATNYVSFGDTSVFSKSVIEQYAWAFYTAVATVGGLQTSYNPVALLERTVTIMTIFTGAALYGTVIGHVSSVSSGLDSSGRMFKQKIEEVNEYMTYRNLSRSLQTKVRHFFQLKYRGKYFDEIGILEELSDSLRQEVTIHNCSDLIAKVDFLSRKVGDGRDDNFLGRIADALNARYYVKGDTIFEQGRPGNEMYFILSGCVEIIVASQRIGVLSDGAFFGEVALLGQVPRTATIKAFTDTVAYRLHRTDFEDIVTDFPDMALKIRTVYEERMAKVRKEREMLYTGKNGETGPVSTEKEHAIMQSSELEQQEIG
ncbi:uncharacterized protein SPPG_04362 [Spizellomyces punctatus DAOM BR117]|uniref:Cyclic nucleotide-binding domain-containing protein n=1 Tax=Spizellomyces punctatus (strain DAOM BR117) TaxID=645134 RepID=A0A0L0HEX5_SPIPD|nr:uncharacterized protein SPPG_04362 [Spizellomyces punctatus DAOM BR117]KND00016.1 hypothetical protein SPPG_04362 [Spizellomyces punctatus DAOM BR117]|eukprot:XP_016608055.1 hypothetical protein SPPG_04362 [Spizellomyces punctatus DAOM BR117]